jgi:hypothetical protein
LPTLWVPLVPALVFCCRSQSSSNSTKPLLRSKEKEWGRLDSNCFANSIADSTGGNTRLRKYAAFVEKLDTKHGRVKQVAFEVSRSFMYLTGNRSSL